MWKMIILYTFFIKFSQQPYEVIISHSLQRCGNRLSEEFENFPKEKSEK